MFCAAPITPYDVILGESWLLNHGGILDYARCQLGRRGILDGEFQLLDLSWPPTHLGDIDAQMCVDESVADVTGQERGAVPLHRTALGYRLKLPHLSTVSRAVMPEASPAEVQAAFVEPALMMDFASAPVLGPSIIAACDSQGCHVEPLMGARAYRAQRRGLQRHYAAFSVHGAEFRQGTA